MTEFERAINNQKYQYIAEIESFFSNDRETVELGRRAIIFTKIESDIGGYFHLVSYRIDRVTRNCISVSRLEAKQSKWIGPHYKAIYDHRTTDYAYVNIDILKQIMWVLKGKIM